MSQTAVPLTAIDELEVRSASEVVATKRIVATDPYLSGHYPDQPIYPGVFVVESARQALDALVRENRGEEWTAKLASVSSLRLLAPLLPGHTLQLHITCTDLGDGQLEAAAKGTRDDGEPVAQVTLRVVPSEENPYA
jgi:3-hydroxyacyl-[acyl-carrier-protein] dehydratase